ncbi:hypothetical protein [Bradyrhizobium archetypum]|uniref:Uncharacterized protein n=1 Tax=Bradyrhizobium archetypum TaxID=2721160 RepID=A0A7Y4M0T8_9BRAD|nr:hypothetical protein [Bradyrhizobium archetypum]NOJ46052.1 hypothetical protein [Bradyrhizobium archetypum]
MRGFNLIGKLVCWVVVSVLLPVFAHAQNRPTTGIIYNTSEWSSLHYECHLQTDGTLNCNMTQASVRRESGGKKLQEEIAKSVAQLKTEKPLKAEECAQWEQTVEKIKNPKPGDEGYTQLSAMEPPAKQDLLKSVSAVIEFCKNPSEQAMVKLTTLNFDRESRTCIVGTNNFALQFKRVSGSQTWASNNGPDGHCGVVTVARLEPDAKYPTFYNYVQKKVVTIPSASMLGNMKCSDMIEQGEYRFVWQSRDIYARCDYIKFGF